MSIDRWMDKDDLVHTHNGIPLRHKKEWSNVICSNMDGPRHYLPSEEVRTRKANTHDWIPMPSKLNSRKRPERYLKINIVPNVPPDNTYSTQYLFGWLQLNFPRFFGQKMWSRSWVFFFSHFICNLFFKDPLRTWVRSLVGRFHMLWSNWAHAPQLLKPK